MNQLANNLNILIERQKLTESELARRTNINQPIINRIRNKNTENPKIEILMALANYFCISIDQLLGVAHLPDSDQTNHTGRHFGWSEVPIIGWDDIENYKNGDKFFSSGYISIDIPQTKRQLFAVTVDTNSMMPTFPMGMKLIFDGQICKSSDFSEGSYFLVKFSDRKQPVLREAMFDGEVLYASSINKSIEEFKKVSENDLIVAGLIQARNDFFAVEGKNNNVDNVFRHLKVVK